MPDRPPFAEALRHEVLHDAFADYELVVVLVTPADSELDAAIVASKAADQVPDDLYGGLWHIGRDSAGREGVSFHLIERGRGDSGLERVWAVYEPPASLVDALSQLPHLVALLPQRHAGPAQQSSLDLRQRLAEALIVDVEDHSATMRLHLRAGG
jgi:hypothetical protein